MITVTTNIVPAGLTQPTYTVKYNTDRVCDLRMVRYDEDALTTTTVFEIIMLHGIYRDIGSFDDVALRQSMGRMEWVYGPDWFKELWEAK